MPRQRRQFQGTFDEVLTLKESKNPASLIDAAGETLVFTVPGAAVGDFVLWSAGVDLVDMTVTAYVQAADKVEVRIQNESGATVDLAASDWRVAVLKPNAGIFV